MDQIDRNHTGRSNIGEKPGEPARVSSEAKAFPRYDDILHIDSAAIAAPEAPPIPNSDPNPHPHPEPDTTRYTELYCGSDLAIR